MDDYARGVRHAELALAAVEGEHPWPLDMRVGNSLLWLCAAESLLWGQPDYDERRTADVNGRVFPGLRFARDSVTHRLVATSQAGGLEYPLGGTTGTLEYPPVWRPRSELGEPDPLARKGSRRRDVEATIYDTEVAGRRVRQPLERGLAWLVSQCETRR